MEIVPGVPINGELIATENSVALLMSGDVDFEKTYLLACFVNGRLSLVTRLSDPTDDDEAGVVA